MEGKPWLSFLGVLAFRVLGAAFAMVLTRGT